MTISSRFINTFYSLVALIFFILAIFLSINNKSEAFTSGGSGSAPVIDSYAVRIGPTINDDIASPMILNAGTTKNFHIVAKVHDNDGASTININRAAFYRTSIGEECGDNRSCRDIDESNDCTKTNTSSTEATIVCDFYMYYWGDSTDSTGTYASDDWTARLTINDGSMLTTKTTFSTEVASLMSLLIQEDDLKTTLTQMDYGNLALSTASSGIYANFLNKGNVELDIDFSSNGLSCDSGNLTANRQKFDISNKIWVNMDNTMSTTPTEYISSLGISNNDDTGDATKVMYFKLRIPSSGVGGSCSGINYFSPSNAN